MVIFDLIFTDDLKNKHDRWVPYNQKHKKVILKCYSTKIIAFFSPQKLDWMAAILDFSTTAARGEDHAGSRKIMNAYDGIYPWYKFGNFRTKWTIQLLYWTKLPDY